MSDRVGVIGAGSWGTTLAVLLAEKNLDVTLWVYEASDFEIMRSERENTTFLPGIKLPSSLKPTGSMAEAVEGQDFLVVAAPTHAMRSVLGQMAPLMNEKQIIVNVSKGIENDTLLRMSQLIAELTPATADTITTLHGPSHAEEVSRGIATAVTVASENMETAQRVQELFRTEGFRVYSSTDIIGVEIGGSLKNVTAIAAGIADGAGFGDNTKAALMTRALAEMARLARKMGADPQTLGGLSGMGDLIVTCMSKHSRNRYVGEQIGMGRKLDDVLEEMVMVAEGVYTTRSAHALSKKYDVDMPIAEQVYAVLFEGKSPQEAVVDLMTRDPKSE